MEYSINKNPQHNSVEITFPGKPSEAVRDALKALKYRWHSVRRVWYGYTTEDAARAAIDGAESGGQAETKAAKESKHAAPVKNKFGVQVGTLFSASWGYEQTNVDFFQVVELVGESSVRVREVYPEMIEESGVSQMSADRTYQNTLKMLPFAKNPTFIKDQEHGDLKRLKSFVYNGEMDVCFRIDSFANAYIVKGDKIKCYESWYA